MSDDARENQLSGAEREFESALRSLAPAGDLTIDPIAAAFQAGRRTQVRHTHVWRGASVVATIAATVLVFVPLTSRAPVDRPQDMVRVVSSASPTVEMSDQSVLRLRDAVLDRGWGALPATVGGGGASGRVMGARDML